MYPLPRPSLRIIAQALHTDKDIKQLLSSLATVCSAVLDSGNTEADPATSSREEDGVATVTPKKGKATPKKSNSKKGK